MASCFIQLLTICYHSIFSCTIITDLANEATSSWPVVLLTCSCHSLSTCLFSATTGYFKMVLVSLLQPCNKPFLQGSWFLLVENGYFEASGPVSAPDEICVFDRPSI